MNIQPNKCIKCQCDIIRNGAPLSVYREFELETDTKLILSVGICCDCVIKADEWKEVGSAIQDSLPQIQVGNIIGIRSIKGLTDILKELQGNRCNKCNKPLGDKFVINAGRIICEFCKNGGEEIKKPEGELKANPLAGAMSKKEVKRKERKNVSMQDLRVEGGGDSVFKGAGKGLER